MNAMRWHDAQISWILRHERCPFQIDIENATALNGALSEGLDFSQDDLGFSPDEVCYDGGAWSRSKQVAVFIRQLLA